MASSAPSGEAAASPTLESIPAPVQDMAALNVKDPVTEAVTEAIAPETEAAEVPPHRSHDPTNNLKRSDPFQFGSRYLSEGDDVFEFNAWDHVETDDAYKEYAEQQYAKQRQNPVSDFEKSKSPPKFSHQVFFLSQVSPDDTTPMHSSSESTEDKLFLLILSLPSDSHLINSLFHFCKLKTRVANMKTQENLVRTPLDGGTCSIRTMPPISSRIENGFSRNFLF